MEKLGSSTRKTPRELSDETWNALESYLRCFDCSGKQPGLLWLPGKHQVYPGVSQAKRAFPNATAGPDHGC